MALRDGRQKFFVQIVDTNEEPITSELKVRILTANSNTNATVYSDEIGTALTNPITATAFAALSPNALVKWWSSATSFDIEIIDNNGFSKLAKGVTGADHRIVFDKDANPGSSLVFCNTAAGAELVDSAGTFVDYPHTVTLDGSELKAGDVLHLSGMVLCADFYSTEELDIKVLVGTEAVLQTGDIVIAANDDTISWDIYVKVNAGGASGTLMTWGTWWKDLGGSVTHYIVAPTGSAKEVSEDISGDVVVKVQGDYASAHADQESYLMAHLVEVMHQSPK